MAPLGDLVGEAAVTRAVCETLTRAARSRATVLLEGEPGTGKRDVARALHELSPRRAHAFAVVTCRSGFDPSSLGDADGGTLFLDEIGELPYEIQPRLLRALDEHQAWLPEGGAMRAIDLRIIAASSRDLLAAMSDGRFRAELYFRVAVVRARLPPLRERLDDLPQLVARLVESLGGTQEQVAALTTADALAELRVRPWRGNLPELREHLRGRLRTEAERRGDEAPFHDARSRALVDFERRYLERLLDRHAGHVRQAAEAAGLSRMYLYRLLSKHGLQTKPRA